MTEIDAQLARGVPVLSLPCGPSVFDFVRIPPGHFLMGSPPGEPGRGEEEPEPFHVRIGRPFYLARHPATQAQYVGVTGVNPAAIRGDRLPVDQLTFADAQAFARRIAEITATRVTLPTELQWEYACRAGTTTAVYSGGAIADLDRVAWYRANSDGQHHEVAQKQPNAWGLFDMLGNVFEPCIENLLSADVLGQGDQGALPSDIGIARGGGWMSSASRCRAAARMQTNDMFGGMGVRLLIPG